MKRFLTAVVATFFLLTTVAHADSWKSAYSVRLRLFDHSVNNVLSDMKKVLASGNLPAIRGTHDYTGNDGFKYRESYFGISDKNRLIFQLNDKGAVGTAKIICSAKYAQDSASAACLLSSIAVAAGMDGIEAQMLCDNAVTWVDKFNAQKGNNATKTFSVWYAKAKRYIDLKMSIKDANSPNRTVTYILSAHN